MYIYIYVYVYEIQNLSTVHKKLTKTKIDESL